METQLSRKDGSKINSHSNLYGVLSNQIAPKGLARRASNKAYKTSPLQQRLGQGGGVKGLLACEL